MPATRLIVLVLPEPLMIFLTTGLELKSSFSVPALIVMSAVPVPTLLPLRIWVPPPKIFIRFVLAMVPAAVTVL